MSPVSLSLSLLFLTFIFFCVCQVIILDVRVPCTPVARLNNHRACVNGIAWAPHSSVHICTAGKSAVSQLPDIIVLYCPPTLARLLTFFFSVQLTNVNHCFHSYIKSCLVISETLYCVVSHLPSLPSISFWIDIIVFVCGISLFSLIYSTIVLLCP